MPTTIRQRRQAAGLAVRELAAQAGVSASHLSQVESAKARASGEFLARIAGALRLAPGDLAERPLRSPGSLGSPNWNLPRFLGFHASDNPVPTLEVAFRQPSTIDSGESCSAPWIPSPEPGDFGGR
ncbi:MAG: helix-turn-helix transcriptional regulator [Armatimonadetes bacterium]|nr:helix-turn-helix transcriptional regulator [Armatimonadota bacterium]